MRKLLPGPRLRRGLFRVWIVVAVVWVPAVAIGLRGEWPRESLGNTLVYLGPREAAGLSPAYFIYDPLVRADWVVLHDALRVFPKNEIGISFATIDRNYTRVLIPKEQWTTKKDGFLEAVKRRRGKYWWTEFSHYRDTFAQLALLPLLALAAGMVVVPIVVKWVALGFAEPGEGPEE